MFFVVVKSGCCFVLCFTVAPPLLAETGFERSTTSSFATGNDTHTSDSVEAEASVREGADVSCVANGAAGEEEKGAGAHAQLDKCEQLSIMERKSNNTQNPEHEHEDPPSTQDGFSAKLRAEKEGTSEEVPPACAEHVVVDGDVERSSAVEATQSSEQQQLTEPQVDRTDAKTTPAKDAAENEAVNKPDLPDESDPSTVSNTDKTAAPVQQTSSNDFRDLSSQNIVSKYFSTELRVDVTKMTHQQDTTAAVTSETTTVSSEGVGGGVLSCNDDEVKEDKYEQILKKTLKQRDSLSENDVIDANRKLQSQNSYEAAMQRAFAAELSSDVTSGAKASDVTCRLDSLDDCRSDVRMSRQTDGRDAIERTTTLVAGDRESTDQLIKRILAESRGDTLTSSTQRSNRRETRSDEFVVDDVNFPSARRMRDSQPVEHIGSDVSATHRRGMYDDDVRQVSGGATGHDDVIMSPRTREQMEMSPRYRSGAMQRQHALYEEQAESFLSAGSRYARYRDEDDDEDDVRMRRRREAEDVVFEDEEFIPQKAVDTDEVRTEFRWEIRFIPIFFYF